MLVTIPDMNPIRFIRYNEVPDWVTYFPNTENVRRQENNIPGIFPTDVYSDWISGKTLSLQLRLTLDGTENLSVYKYSDGAFALEDTIVPVDITPVGWISEKINRYDYTPAQAGVYYLESSSAGIRSDKFLAHSDLKYKKRLVQIQFVNSKNDFMMIFDDNGTPRYTGLAYFTGQLKFAQPENKITVLETNRGTQLLKLKSAPVPVANLTLTDLHYTDVDKVNMIFSCNQLTINGLSYQNAEVGEPEQIEQSDLVRISVKLKRTNYSYGK